MSKLKILLHDLGSCEGCQISILRVYPRLTAFAELYSRYLGNHTLNGKFDVAVVTGSVCINEPRIIEELKKIRENTHILIAYGSCASVGGVTLFARGGKEPRPEHRTYFPLSHVVEVDYAIPGCPSAPTFLVNLLNMIMRSGGHFLTLFVAVAKAKKLSGFDLQDEIVLPGLCIGCGACVLSCPTHALQMVDGRPDLLPEKCIRCGTCVVRCPRYSQLLIQKFKPKVKTLQPLRR